VNIICKLYNEEMMDKDELLKISKYILDIKNFESFFEIMKITQISDLFEQLKEIKLSKLDRIILREVLSKNPIYVKIILSFDADKFEPYKFISLLFKFRFNLNLLSIEDLLIDEYKYSDNKTIYPKNYIINIFKTLIDLFETEEKL
jgi:hypothetical protein